MGVGGQRHAAATLPPGNTRYPLNVGLVGRAPGPVWTGVENLAPPPPHPPHLPPGFDSQTVQPVGTCYAVYAIPSHIIVGANY
jgi:hypothetical protein